MGQWSRKDHPEPFIELVPYEHASGLRKAIYDELERVRVACARRMVEDRGEL